MDYTQGHCYEPQIFIQGSPDVFVNTYKVVRKTDQILPHCCGASCHVGEAVGNNSGVYANNLLVEVQTNDLTCGDHAANGSPDVYCGV